MPLFSVSGPSLILMWPLADSWMIGAGVMGAYMYFNPMGYGTIANAAAGYGVAGISVWALNGMGGLARSSAAQ